MCIFLLPFIAIYIVEKINCLLRFPSTKNFYVMGLIPNNISVILRLKRRPFIGKYVVTSTTPFVPSLSFETVFVLHRVKWAFLRLGLYYLKQEQHNDAVQWYVFV